MLFWLLEVTISFLKGTPPAQRVQFILGEDVDDGTRISHPLFCEMVELFGEGEDMEWRETARWIKFEEVRLQGFP